MQERVHCLRLAWISLPREAATRTEDAIPHTSRDIACCAERRDLVSNIFRTPLKNAIRKRRLPVSASTAYSRNSRRRSR